MIFQGAGIALPTPFLEDGKIDFQSFEKHIQFLLKNHADALIVTGTTGESATLEIEEKIQIWEWAVKNFGNKVPIIAGTGHNNTKEAIRMTEIAYELKVNACMVITPYYNKSNQRGMYQHFRAVADAVDMPIMLYNVPGRTSTVLEPETTLALSQHKNIVAIKEAHPTIESAAKILRKAPKNFYVYSGTDTLNLPLAALGAVGVTSVVGNVLPKEVHDIFAYAQKDLKKAQEAFFRTFALSEALFWDISPTPLKYILRKMGLIEQETLRMPLIPIDEVMQGRLDQVAKEANLY